jgi:hypothetical protein
MHIWPCTTVNMLNKLKNIFRSKDKFKLNFELAVPPYLVMFVYRQDLCFDQEVLSVDCDISNTLYAVHSNRVLRCSKP